MGFAGSRFVSKTGKSRSLDIAAGTAKPGPGAHSRGYGSLKSFGRANWVGCCALGLAALYSQGMKLLDLLVGVKPAAFRILKWSCCSI
jgi:hypothetical protein